jgi:hypothetical protein
MRSPLLSVSLAMFVMIVLLARLPAQQPNPAQAPPPAPARPEPGGNEEDYRRFFKKPTNATEYWNALQFEIDVGKFDLAAAHLRGLLAYKPSDEELVKLADQVGVAAFLRLRNIQKWSDDPKVNQEAVKNVDELIKRVTDAVKKVRGDPARIQGFIANLNASPEENAYALRELNRSGAVVVPYLIDALRKADLDQRVRLLDALRRLEPDTIEPMIAALDSNDAELQIELIRIFMRRNATQVVPYLWFLAGSPAQPDSVRQQATAALSYFLAIPPDMLPPPKFELTRLADRYYQHQVKFTNPAAVTVWRWDGNRIVEGWPNAPTVPADKAEEYYGLRFAGQALTIDPTYVPAQEVLLSLVLDKAQSNVGLDQSLEKASPAVHGLLGTVQPSLVNAVLERALVEHRVPVILGAVRDLGERAEVRALRPLGRRQPPLVRAIYYPDPRVQMAAVEALLRIPNSAQSQATTRVIEILRRAVAGEPALREPAKVMVGYFNDDVRNAVATAVAAAGYVPIRVTNGRDMMLRLGQASDIALLLFDEDLPYPGLAPLLGQLSADNFSAHLPILLTTSALREVAVRRYTERWPNITVLPAPVAIDSRLLKSLIDSRLGDPGNPALSAAELKAYAEGSIKNLACLSRGEVPGYDVTPAGPTVLAALRPPTRLTPEGQISAIEIASRIRGENAQTVLADVLLDGKRPAAVRVAAANALIRNIQQFSPLLTGEQVRALDALYAQANLEESLKNSAALVIGSLRPSTRLTGQRLLQYQPPTPGAAPPPKPEPKSEPKPDK